MQTHRTIAALTVASLALGACAEGDPGDAAPAAAVTDAPAQGATAAGQAPYPERLRAALAPIGTIHRRSTDVVTALAIEGEPVSSSAVASVAEAASGVSGLDDTGAPSGVPDAVTAYLAAIEPLALDIDEAASSGDLAAFVRAEQAWVAENAALLNAADDDDDLCRALVVVIGHAEHGRLLCPTAIPGGEWGRAAHRVMRSYAIQTTTADPNRIGFVEPLAQSTAGRPNDTFTNVDALRRFYDAVLPTIDVPAEHALEQLARLTPPTELTAWHEALVEHVQSQREGRQVLLQLTRAGAPTTELIRDGANPIADASRAISAALSDDACVIGVTLDRSAHGCG